MLNNQDIFEILFDRNYSDRENIAFLKDITETHPYFTPAQFYLLQLTDNGTEQFNTQVDKTNILFNNPHWLNFQLQQTDRELMTVEKVEAGEKVDGVIGVHVVDEGDMVNGIEAVEEVDEAEKGTGVDDVVELFDAKVVEEVGLVNEVENAGGGIGVDDIEEVGGVVDVNQVYDVEVNEEVGLVDEVDRIKEVEEVAIADEIEKDAGIDDVKAVDEVPAPVYEQSKETYPEESIVQSRDDLAGEPDATEDVNGNQGEPELEPMKIELKMPEQKANLDEAMLFEPMHIVDYFASQGIKLTDVVQPGDKLGKQLKSFTEWLKTMKKIHVENEVAATADTGTVIQTLAEISNINTEVLTESMAEVFVKQGKMAKAGELYQKLSLLNPAKSAYFAAKIENLKEI